MGAEASRVDQAAATNASELARQVAEACSNGTLDKFEQAWNRVEEYRKAFKEENKADQDKVMETELFIWDKTKAHIEFSLKRPDPAWRKQGIEIARTFFALEQARKDLVSMDFIQFLLLNTLPDRDDDEEDDDDGKAQNKNDKQARQDRENEGQSLAARTMREIAGYPDFVKTLCRTAVLNFLSIVLNQIKEEEETVTDTFVKISKDSSHLVLLVEDSVGDILESFFRTVSYEKSEDDDGKMWHQNVSALSNCAHTLATLIKNGHQVRIYKPRIIKVFQYIVPTRKEGSLQKDEDEPLKIRMLAEMSRLLFWICRQTKDVMETLLEASSSDTSARNLNEVLEALTNVWSKCVGVREGFRNVQTDSLPPEKLADPESQEYLMHHSQMCLCHINCLLWVLLPESTIRWKFKRLDLKPLHYAFELRNSECLTVVLGTVRNLVDLPQAQECHDLIKFFGEQLLLLLDMTLRGEVAHGESLNLLLEALSILAMQRGMQEMLADYDCYRAFEALNLKCSLAITQKLSILRINASVAMHPSFRLSWVAKSSDNGKANDPTFVYPNRDAFTHKLEELMSDREPMSPEDSEGFKTIAAFLLNTFSEEKFKKSAEDIETTFKALFEWWQEYTTARFEDEKASAEAQQGSAAMQEKPLSELLQLALMRQEERRTLKSMETLAFCRPYECVFALSLFSRLALEPKFKKQIFNTALQPLLGCVCVGIWAEAREAAATIANLMWQPDLNEEKLVCWLKFDGPKCVTVDAANVLIPVKKGTPEPVDLGKGMFNSSWGVKFVERTCVTLHPDGFRTHEVPGILTTASPLSTFQDTSRDPYAWLDEQPNEKHFTITCWFYWPLEPTNHKDAMKSNKVLLQSKSDKTNLIYLDCEKCEEKTDVGIWTLVVMPEGGGKATKKPLRTPKLNDGWHMLSIVSCTVPPQQPGLARPPDHTFHGTLFYLDDWSVQLPKLWLKNDFYMVGNAQDGRVPFGLIADFRIYARALLPNEIGALWNARDTDNHPDQIARRLAQMGAANILAARLDIPDSAAECLRALGSLATLVTQRAKIYSICGRTVLKMLDSPLPMIQRQAARLLNNLT